MESWLYVKGWLIHKDYKKGYTNFASLHRLNLKRQPETESGLVYLLWELKFSDQSIRNLALQVLKLT